MTAPEPPIEIAADELVSFGEHTVQVTPWERGVPGPAPRSTTELRWGLLDGAPVVAKLAGGSGRDQLRREAEVLSRCATLRVTRVLELLEATDHTELRLRRVEGPTLADAALMSPAERTRALVGLCRAVDGLHRHGWTHRRLSAPHVLVDRRGRVTLCSLAAAEQVSTERPGPAVLEDRSALVTLVGEVLGTPAGFGTVVERIRWTVGARQAELRMRRRRGLLGPDALGALLVGTHLPTSPGGRRRPEPGTQRSRRIPVAARFAALLAAVLLVGIVAAVGMGMRHGRGDTETPACPAVERSHATSAPGGSVHGPSEGVVDVDGDGCDDGVRMQGREVEVGGTTYRVGRPGDIAAIGDWNCDGRATVALLRPATGEVFEFSDWAAHDDTEDARMTATIDGAVDIQGPEGSCGPPRVELDDSSLVDARTPEES